MREVRFALRSLRKAPGFSLGASLTLALAIGATSAIFSAVSAILFRPSSIHRPEELVIAWEKDAVRQLEVVELTYRSVEAWARHSRSFSSLAAIGSSTWPVVLDHGGEAMRVSSAGVSSAFFETLGVVPEIGRTFTAADDQSGAPRVVVLSHRFWATRFGADPRVVGSTLQLSRPHIVVGVMPEGFDFPRGTDYWTPVVPVIAGTGASWTSANLQNVGVLFVVGRLRDGVSRAQASDDLNRLAADLSRDPSILRFGSTVVVKSFVDHVLGPVRPALWALLSAVLILLCIGCANVSGLVLSRVSLRTREQAVRSALGASRRQLATQWMLEVGLLAMVGGLAGLAVSFWIVQGIVALAPDDVAGVAEISVDLRVTAFTFVIALVTAVLCGLVPVRHAGRPDLAHVLNDVRHTPSRRSARARSAMVIVQIALTVVLVVAAALVARSFANIQRLQLGFVPDDVITMRVSPRIPKPSANVWMHDFIGRVSGLPDVKSVGAVYLRPLALGAIGQETSTILEGQPLGDDSARQNPALNYEIATPGYFATMRIPLVRGRLFTTADGPASPRVVLVSESTARRLWPGQDPIGRRMLLPTMAGDGAPSWGTVVGVVGDVRYRGIDDARFDVYDAPLQSPLAATDLVIRATGDPARVAAAVQAEARRLDPRVVVDGMTTMDAIVSRAVAPWKFSVLLFSLFAGLAFVLSSVGLFSLVTLDVVTRRHELAVRHALGAAPRDLVRSVLGSAAVRLGVGLSCGLVAAVAGTRAMRGLLFGVEPLDLGTYAFVLAAILSVVMTAAYLPARKAGTIDPLDALRR